VEDHVRRGHLVEEFADGASKRRGAQRRGGAKRNDERMAAASAALVGGGTHRALALLTGGHVAHVGAKDAGEQRVGGRPGLGLPIRDQDAAHAEAGRDRGGGTRVVRLDAAAGDERVGPVRLRLCRDEPELANLVAAEPERDRVVALGEEAHRRRDPAAEPRQRLDKRRAGADVERRQGREAMERGRVDRHERLVYFQV
jgi:hypothetical protein